MKNKKGMLIKIGIAYLMPLFDQVGEAIQTKNETIIGINNTKFLYTL